MNNSFSIYKNANSKQITQLHFSREIVLTYLKKYGTAQISAGRPSKHLSSYSRVSVDIRLGSLSIIRSRNEKKDMCTRRL